MLNLWSRFPELITPEQAVRRRKLTWLAVGVLVFMAIGAVFLWLYFAGDDRAVARAQKFEYEQDYRRAQLTLEQTVQVNPRNMDARRALASFYERVGANDAVGQWRQLLDLEPDNELNAFGLAGVAVQNREWTIAGEALARVPTAARESADFHRLSAAVAAGVGDLPGLERHLTALTVLEPGKNASDYNLAALRYRSADPAKAAEARAQLVNYARGGPYRIRATLELVKDARTIAAVDALAGEIMPPAPGGWSGRRAPRGLFEISEHMQAEAKPDPRDAAALVRWMVGQGGARESLVWAGTLPPEVLGSADLRSARADAAAALRDWRLLQRLLIEGAWRPVSADVINLAFAARVQRDRSSIANARATWSDAVELANNSLSALRALQRLAELWNWPEESERASRQLVTSFPRERGTWIILAQLAEASVSTDKLLRLLNDWAQAVPDDLEVQASRLFLAVLSENADATQIRTAKAAVNRPGALPEVLAAGALLLWREGSVSEALNALRPHEAAIALRPRAALVYGALLAEQGDASAANKYLTLGNSPKLLPEEKALLQRARGKLAGRN